MRVAILKIQDKTQFFCVKNREAALFYFFSQTKDIIDPDITYFFFHKVLFRLNQIEKNTDKTLKSPKRTKIIICLYLSAGLKAQFKEMYLREMK